MSNAHPDGAAVGTDALQQHFEGAPVGMLLLAGDRSILRANETMSSITGLAPAILAGSPFRRFLSTDAPLDLEDRIFEELEHAGRWVGEVDIRTSIGDTSPMLVTITPVAKIQTVTATESPFDRRAAMAAVQVDTASGRELSQRLHIPYLARDTARALFARLSAQAAQTAVRW